MPVPVLVLNFGHSVLKTLEDYTEAASEIYRHYRQGQNVVAVTSAQGDQTDVLMAEARQIGSGDNAKNLAELISLGERRSAALLALALERVGAPAYVRQARDLGLKAAGTGSNARLTALDTDQLLLDLKNHDIVVMPGYVAIGDNDRPALLGQGGADLTALYVTQQLKERGAGDRCILLKDIDGVYDRDPKEAGDEAKRYESLSFSDAKELTKVLIAKGALAFANKHGLEFNLGTPGIPFYTRIGASTSKTSAPKRARKLRVALLGCGVVGGGVMRRIEANSDRFEVVKIMVRNIKKYTDQGVKADLLTTEFSDLVAAKPDIFVDVSGGVEPALSQTLQMLESGVHVVSANKQAIAAGKSKLAEAEKAGGSMLCASSSAGGGMPILEMCIREHGRIVKVEALLNGTTNYMLDEISAGASYEEALKDAQEKGFAEADPSSDVGGGDAAAKIRLVARYGFGVDVELDEIPCETIVGFSGEGYKGSAKRVATCYLEDGQFKSVLKLKDLPEDDFMAQAKSEEAHAEFTFTDGDVYRIRGKGAGRWPTAEAVMADLFDISQSRAF